jgi:glycine/D-amino acid oxidase-like deaminating enzyme
VDFNRLPFKETPNLSDNNMKPECPEKAQVIIIGSGIIGAAIAYYLSRKGISDVLVLEQGEIGSQGATSACLGGLRTQCINGSKKNSGLIPASNLTATCFWQQHQNSGRFSKTHLV